MHSKALKTRYQLSKKDTRAFLEKLRRNFGEEMVILLSKFKKIEKIDTRIKDASIYAFDKKPLFLEIGKEIYPTILHAEIFKDLIPIVIVDMGAVPHIVNGADVMVPGIRKVSREFHKDAIVLIADEEKERIFCVGKALMSSNKIFTMRKGRAIKNLHHVKDAFWNLLLNL